MSDLKETVDVGEIVARVENFFNIHAEALKNIDPLRVKRIRAILKTAYFQQAKVGYLPYADKFDENDSRLLEKTPHQQPEYGTAYSEPMRPNLRNRDKEIRGGE